MSKQNRQRAFGSVTYCLIIPFLTMKNFRNLMSIIVVLTAVYSCEPEEMPIDLAASSETEIDPGTEVGVEDNGEDDDETKGSHGD